MTTFFPRDFCTTIIVSIYNDVEALDLILSSLKKQTYTDFEIIVSEDGESDSVKHYISSINSEFPRLTHLTQADEGFRKNRALNRAISASHCDHLIFIDGDCIPHKKFIEAHRRYAQKGVISVGRRVELGEKTSEKIRKKVLTVDNYSSNLKYLVSLFSQIKDKVKNYEYGFYFPFLQNLSKNRPIKILGCNFSCFKDDLLAVNGFNQDFISPGLGEDSDIEWRLLANGAIIKNIKFTAIQYHLDHPRMYTVSEENKEILRTTEEQNQYICKNGIK